MRLSVLRPSGWLYYRACVALRQILKAWKKPVVRRVRKAALIGTLCLATACSCGAAGDEIYSPDTNASLRRQSQEMHSDGIRPIHQLSASIAPPAGELPTNLAAQRFAQTNEMDLSALGGRGWTTYAYFWQSPALCFQPLCCALVSRYGICR
jgi:hypothetical protein